MKSRSDARFPTVTEWEGVRAFERWRDADPNYRSGVMARAGFRAGYLEGRADERRSSGPPAWMGYSG